MGRIVEGVWDCPYCGKTKIPGLEAECPTCGKQRDASTKFYIADPSDYLTEEEQKTVSKEPDWLCQYCNSYNSANSKRCTVCGHDRDTEDSDYFATRQTEEEKAAKRAAEEAEYNPPSPPPNRGDNGGDPPKKGLKAKQIGIISIICAVVLAIAAIGIFFSTPIKDTVTIDKLTWEYVQPISHYIPVQEDDWQLPSGGRLIRTAEEIKSYESVLDHYETVTETKTREVLDHYETVVTGHKDLGNGTFEEITSEKPVYKTETYTETHEEPVYRQEPIYATKYYYEIDKWVHARDVTTSGEDKEPYVGEYELAENERTDTLKETYTAYMSSEKDKYTKEISKQQWETLNVGDSVGATIDRIGDGITFDFEEPKK